MEQRHKRLEEPPTFPSSLARMINPPGQMPPSPPVCQPLLYLDETSEKIIPPAHLGASENISTHKSNDNTSIRHDDIGLDEESRKTIFEETEEKDYYSNRTNIENRTFENVERKEHTSKVCHETKNESFFLDSKKQTVCGVNEKQFEIYCSNVTINHSMVPECTGTCRRTYDSSAVNELQSANEKQCSCTEIKSNKPKELHKSIDSTNFEFERTGIQNDSLKDNMNRGKKEKYIERDIDKLEVMKMELKNKDLELEQFREHFKAMEMELNKKNLQLKKSEENLKSIAIEFHKTEKENQNLKGKLSQVLQELELSKQDYSTVIDIMSKMELKQSRSKEKFNKTKPKDHSKKDVFKRPFVSTLGDFGHRDFNAMLLDVYSTSKWDQE